MAMHRQHPAPQSDLPRPAAPPALPPPTMTRPEVVDVTICEWTADQAGTPLSTEVVRTTVSAMGYVDFDAVDSVHETLVISAVKRS